MAVLEFLIPVVREVGKLLLQSLGQAQSIQFKGRANLVTEMDRRSEEHLIRAIRARHPDRARPRVGAVRRAGPARFGIRYIAQRPAAQRDPGRFARGAVG